MVQKISFLSFLPLCLLAVPRLIVGVRARLRSDYELDCRLPYQISHQNSSEWVHRGTLIKPCFYTAHTGRARHTMR